MAIRPKDIRELLRDFTATGVNTLLGEVSEIDETERTCTLTHEGLAFYDVRLQCITGGNSGVLIVPKEGSMALALKIEEGDGWMIVQCSEADKIEVSIGEETKIEVSEDGIVMNGGTVGMAKTDKLIEWMTKVYTDLQSIQTTLTGGVTTPAGAGTMTVPFTGVTTPQPNLSDFADDAIKH